MTKRNSICQSERRKQNKEIDKILPKNAIPVIMGNRTQHKRQLSEDKVKQKLLCLFFYDFLTILLKEVVMEKLHKA